MGRAINRLSATEVAKTLGPGFHADGGGLYLRVDDAGGRRWVFMFKRDKRRHEMGLGPISKNPLAAAREEARQARLDLGAGKDPIAERRRRRAAVDAPTFGEFADDLVASLKPSWKNPVHAGQWVKTVEVECASLRPKRLPDIATADVLEVLKPIWTATPETGRRSRGRIEFILDAAKAKGFREGDNPARWRGHLDKLLAKRKRSSRRKHPALPYREAKTFFADMRGADTVSAQALEFTILTIARTNEVQFALKTEIDLAEGAWNVPGERMKGGLPHRVPLTPAALTIARDRIENGPGPYLFNGRDQATHMSNNAMLKCLKVDLGRSKYTVHGFRSTFRDWAGDCTTFAREIIEFCLAHVEAGESEKSYWRSDVFDRRRQVLEAWEAYCEPAIDNVVRIA